MQSVNRFFLITIMTIPMLLAPTAFAGPANRLRVDILEELRRPRLPGEKIVIHDIDLGREELDTLELEPMEVWAPDAKIRVWGPDGHPTEMPVPEYDNYKGSVVGSDESLVFISHRKGRLVGAIIIGMRKFSLGTAYPAGPRQPRYQDPTIDLSGERLPFLIAEVDDLETAGEPAPDWSCGVDEQPGTMQRPAMLEPRPLTALPENGGVSGAAYTLRIALDTDNELCAGFGNNATSVTNYMNDLIAKSNIIYQRDANTTLVIGSLEIRNGGGGTDPWTKTEANGTAAALYEFGTYWHNSPPGGSTPRSAVSFISGKPFFGGIAWTNVLCDTDFYCGDTGSSCGDANAAGKWGGPYSVVGSLSSVSTTNADPTATINGHEYAMASSGNFWILAAFTHELGHTIASRHTNCYPSGGFTSQQKTTYGIGTTSLPDRSYVDTCLNSGSGCYNGVTTTFPTEWGTIMSYCHNHFDGGFRASRYILGKSGEASELILPVFTGGISAATPDGTITIGGEPISCSAGQTASVPSVANRTYAWEITGGTITSATNTNSITYTPTTASVTVSVTITNTLSNHGCSIRTSATRSTSCSSSSYILMNHPTDGYRIWTVDTNGVASAGTPNATKPPAGWTATSYVRNNDGTGYVLMNHSTDGYRIWTVGADGVVSAGTPNPTKPPAGWTATSYVRNSDGTGYILMNHSTDGYRIWTVGADGVVSAGTPNATKPPAGWTATSYARASDGTGYILMNHSTDGYRIWTVGADGVVSAGTPNATMPPPGWEANSIVWNPAGTLLQ